MLLGVGINPNDAPFAIHSKIIQLDTLSMKAVKTCRTPAVMKIMASPIHSTMNSSFIMTTREPNTLLFWDIREKRWHPLTTNRTCETSKVILISRDRIKYTFAPIHFQLCSC